MKQDYKKLRNEVEELLSKALLKLESFDSKSLDDEVWDEEKEDYIKNPNFIPESDKDGRNLVATKLLLRMMIEQGTPNGMLNEYFSSHCYWED